MATGRPPFNPPVTSQSMVVPSRSDSSDVVSRLPMYLDLHHDVPEGHVCIVGLGRQSICVRYPEVTWDSLQNSASPNQIDYITVWPKNSKNGIKFHVGDDFEASKRFVSEAEMIKKIDVKLKQEPKRATHRQYHVALAVCQAAYETSRNNTPALKQKMQEVGIDKLHKGTNESFSTEFVVAECHEHNEVYIGYRGTTKIDEWLCDAKAFVSQEIQLGGVHAGFFEHMQVVDSSFLFSLVDSGKKVILCGHSLGAAAAAIRLLAMLQRLFRTGKLLDGSVRAIGFGAPLFATETCANYVVKTLSCRNLFDFIVVEGDPVPGLLSDLSQLVKQAVDVNGKSANIDLALEVVRNVAPMMMGVFEHWFNGKKDQIHKALKGVKSMYWPLGHFTFFGTWDSVEVYDPCTIMKRLKGFQLTSSTVFHHQMSIYEAYVGPAVEDSFAGNGEGKLVCPETPRLGSSKVELGAGALWIKLEDCPLHLMRVVLSATNKDDVQFKIMDESRDEVEYFNGTDIVVHRKNPLSKKMAMPKKIRKITLKLPVPRRVEMDAIRELLKDQSATATFITAIGSGLDPIPVGNPNDENVNQESLMVEEISIIYHGVLLSALLELVHDRTPTARRTLVRRPPFEYLSKVSDLVKQIRGEGYNIKIPTNAFVRKLMASPVITDDDVKSGLDAAEQVANQETQALRELITNEDTIKTQPTAGDIAKGAGIAIAVTFAVAGCVVLGAFATGVGVVVVPIVNSAGAVAAATVLTEGAVAVAGVGGAISGIATSVALSKTKEARESLYTEKLKLILNAYSVRLPTQLTASVLETTLLREVENATLSDPKYDDRLLKPESEQLLMNMAQAFANLKRIRNYAEQRTMVALVGVKNAGKSTAGEALFNLRTDAGVSRSTLYPKPYGWESGERKGTIVDFPGATEAKDETMQLAERYLSIGGASVWCLVIINPFTMGTPDCKLIRNVTDRFHRDRIRLVCTHGDVRDTLGRFKVDSFDGGVNGVKDHVVDMLDPDVGISADMVLVCTFANNPGGLPAGVHGKEELRSILRGRIWPI